MGWRRVQRLEAAIDKGERSLGSGALCLRRKGLLLKPCVVGELRPERQKAKIVGQRPAGEHVRSANEMIDGLRGRWFLKFSEGTSKSCGAVWLEASAGWTSVRESVGVEQNAAFGHAGLGSALRQVRRKSERERGRALTNRRTVQA